MAVALTYKISGMKTDSKELTEDASAIYQKYISEGKILQHIQGEEDADGIRECSVIFDTLASKNAYLAELETLSNSGDSVTVDDIDINDIA